MENLTGWNMKKYILLGIGQTDFCYISKLFIWYILVVVKIWWFGQSNSCWKCNILSESLHSWKTLLAPPCKTRSDPLFHQNCLNSLWHGFNKDLETLLSCSGLSDLLWSIGFRPGGCGSHRSTVNSSLHSWNQCDDFSFLGSEVSCWKYPPGDG